MAVIVWTLATAGDRGIGVATTLVLLGCATVLQLLVMGRLPWSQLRAHLPRNPPLYERVLRIVLRPWFFAACVLICTVSTLIQFGVLPAPLHVATLAWMAIRALAAVAILFSWCYYTILVFILTVPPESLH